MIRISFPRIRAQKSWATISGTEVMGADSEQSKKDIEKDIEVFLSSEANTRKHGDQEQALAEYLEFVYTLATVEVFQPKPTAYTIL